MQSVLVTDVAQTAHVIIGHLVGHHTAHIPQEAVRRFLTADHHALVNGQIRRRVVAVAGFELFDHAVGEVLSAGLVAVLNDYAERLAVLGRNAAQNFAHMGIEMGGGMLAAHLVDFEAGSLGRSRRVRRAGRRHTHAQDDPFAFGCVPRQRSVLGHVLRNILHAGRIDDGRRVIHDGLCRPLIVFPVRQRGRVHLGQRFFFIALDARSFRQGHLGQSGAAGRFGENETEIGAGRRRDRDDHRSVRVESDVQRGIQPVQRESGERAVSVVLLDLQFALHRHRTFGGAYGQAARRERGLGFQVDREPAVLRQVDACFRVAVDYLGDACDLRSRYDRCVRRVQRHSVAFRRGICDHSDVLKLIDRLIEFEADLLGTFYSGFRRGQIAHRLFGLYPRASRLAPAGGVEYADLDVQFGRFFQCGVENVPPFVTEHLDVAVRYVVLTDVADERPVDTGLFHRLEVLDDALLRDVVRYPVPVNARLDRVGRSDESRSQRFAGYVARACRLVGTAGGQRGSRQCAKRKFCDFLHGSLNGI